MGEQKHEYVVSYRYYKHGEIQRGGEPTFKAVSPSAAKQTFMRYFKKSEPDYKEHELVVKDPYLSREAKDAILHARLERLEAFVGKVHDEYVAFTGSAENSAYEEWGWLDNEARALLASESEVGDGR